MDTYQINKQQEHKDPNSRGRTASEQISPGPLSRAEFCYKARKTSGPEIVPKVSSATLSSGPHSFWTG